MLSKNWTKLTPSPRNIAFAALVLMGAIAVYNRVVAPHANYVLAAQRYESVANKLIRKKQAIIDDMKIKKNELEGLEEKLEQMRTNLFEPIEAKEFFSDIEVMSGEANCIIYSLNFPPIDSALKGELPETSSHITAERANLSVVGNYKNIITLINRLQDRLEQVSIDSVSIEPIEGNFDQLKCDIALMIYVMHNLGKELP